MEGWIKNDGIIMGCDDDDSSLPAGVACDGSKLVLFALSCVTLLA